MIVICLPILWLADDYIYITFVLLASIWSPGSRWTCLTFPSLVRSMEHSVNWISLNNLIHWTNQTVLLNSRIRMNCELQQLWKQFMKHAVYNYNYHSHTCNMVVASYCSENVVWFHGCTWSKITIIVLQKRAHGWYTIYCVLTGAGCQDNMAWRCP